MRGTWRPLALLGAVLAGVVALPAAQAAPAYDLSSNCTLSPELQFLIDGHNETPPGAVIGDGNPDGFICTGNAYVPLRWFAGLLGKSVTWNGAAHAISVSSSGAVQHGVAFHVVAVATTASGATVGVQIANGTQGEAYASFTVEFLNGFGAVLATIPGPQTGADSFGKLELAPGATRVSTVTSAPAASTAAAPPAQSSAAGAGNPSGYVSIVIVPWAAACPVACPPLG